MVNSKQPEPEPESDPDPSNIKSSSSETNPGIQKKKIGFSRKLNLQEHSESVRAIFFYLASKRFVEVKLQ